MASESDGEDYVYYGTPLEDQKGPVRGFYKAPQDPSKTRALPVWEQEVTDEDGRKRFHGAFTGGFSAGFYNSVGSKEGFVPGSFRTSRSDRARFEKQSIEDFMDEDELADKRKMNLQAKDGYDTFAAGEAATARKQAAMEAESRGSLIPGPIIEEFIQPVSNSIGAKLLQKMGWRQGKGLGAVNQSEKETSLWGPEAALLADNVKVLIMKPKSDFHGLGYDPFKHAEEFRKVRSSDQKHRPLKRSRGVAFGVGILEESDQFGEIEDYVVDETGPKGGQFNFEITSDGSEEDIPPGKQSLRQTNQRLRSEGRPQLRLEASKSSYTLGSFIPGFRQSTTCTQVQNYPPPKVPAGFDLTMRFNRESQDPCPSAVIPSMDPPADPELVKTITTLAVYVARNGPSFEAVAVERHAMDARFGFLFGGDGAEYYKWKLLEQKAKYAKKSAGETPAQRPRPLVADDRRQILGEEELPRSNVAKSGHDDKMELRGQTQTMGSRPYLDEIAESDRKMLQSVLKGNFVRGSTQDLIMEESPKGGLRQPAPQPAEEKGAQEDRGPKPLSEEETDAKAPVRTIEEWRPSPLLCKRFGLPDPFQGKKSSEEKKPMFQTYELNLPQTLGEKTEKKDSEIYDVHKETSDGEGRVDKPLDLFKAIFEASDSSDSESETSGSNPAENLTTEPHTLPGVRVEDEKLKDQSHPSSDTQPVRRSRWDTDVLPKRQSDPSGRVRTPQNKDVPGKETNLESRLYTSTSHVGKSPEDSAAGTNKDIRREHKLDDQGGPSLAASELERLLKVLKKDKSAKRKKKSKKKHKKEREKKSKKRRKPSKE